MDYDKLDFRKGLLYFTCLVFCVCMFVTTPDGVSLFHNFLGLFGISPGIPLGSNSTLYIYMLIPLIAGIVCLKKTLKYWHSYGSRFKEYKFYLYRLPIIIVIVPVLLFSNIVTPSGIDRIYYSLLSQRSGIQAITFYSANNLRYEFTGNNRTFFYDFTLTNHGSESVEFQVKIEYRDSDGFQEVLVSDDNGNNRIFALPPKQGVSYRGNFTFHHQTTYDSGSGQGIYTIVLLNDNEQHQPKELVRYPPLYR